MVHMTYKKKILLCSTLSLFLTLCICIDVVKTAKNEKNITIRDELTLKSTTLDNKLIKIYSSKEIKNVKTIKIDKNS